MYSFNEFASKSEEEDYSDSIYSISWSGNIPILKLLIKEQPYFKRLNYIDTLESARNAAVKKGHEDIRKYLDATIAAENDQ